MLRAFGIAPIEKGDTTQYSAGIGREYLALALEAAAQGSLPGPALLSFQPRLQRAFEKYLEMYAPRFDASAFERLPYERLAKAYQLLEGEIATKQ